MATPSGGKVTRLSLATGCSSVNNCRSYCIAQCRLLQAALLPRSSGTFRSHCCDSYRLPSLPYVVCVSCGSVKPCELGAATKSLHQSPGFYRISFYCDGIIMRHEGMYKM